MTKGIKSLLFLCVIISLASISCKRGDSTGGSGELSTSTGWEYGNQDYGGFEKLDYEGQVNGPNLVLIEGGTFAMGQVSEDVTYEWNNIPRRVTVSSFYMDETEVKNIDWKEYEFWTRRTYTSYPQIWKDLLPDTLVWREELAYNEPYIRTYYRHPSYDEYPVVGVSWEQCQDFCLWRSNRVNEMLLIERGVLNPNPSEQVDSEAFDTEAYLAGQYQGSVRKNLEDKSTGGERAVRFEDGILLPNYRLPTEAEWEYACRAGSSSSRFFGNPNALIRHYAWGLQNSDWKTHPVAQLIPNDFGLFDTHGNAGEWCRSAFIETLDTEKQPRLDIVGAGAVRKSPTRCNRGASFREEPAHLRASIRLQFDPQLRADNLGFRLVKTISTSE